MRKQSHYKALPTEFNLKQDEVAERVSKKAEPLSKFHATVKTRRRVQQMVIDDMISTGHARALLGIDDQEKQYTTAQKIFDEKLSVRETEKLVKKIQQEKRSAGSKGRGKDRSEDGSNLP